MSSGQSTYQVTRTEVPADALLRTFQGGTRPAAWGSYQDCFSLIFDGDVSLEQFVYAFYTSSVFRIERLILRLAVDSPSTDADARAVASGTSSRFAAWYVGQRTSNQLLMCDRFEQTRSWFRALPADAGCTRLEFGTAVAAIRRQENGKAEMSRSFRWLLGLHVLYSKILLRAARAQLSKLKLAQQRND